MPTTRLEMTMSTKKWLVVASLTLTLTGVAGCSTTDSDEATSSAAPDDAATSSAAPDDAATTSGAPGGDAADPAAGPDLSDVPDPVGEVNGEGISKDDFAESYEAQFAQAQMSGQPVDEAQLRSDVFDFLVDTELLLQAAAEGGHEASEEDVDALLEELAVSNGLESGEDFIAALDEQGMDEATVREELAKQVEIEALIEAETDVQDPTEDEIRAVYDDAKEQQEQSAQGADGAAATEGAEQPEFPAFDDVREQIAQQLASEEDSAAADELLEQLREDAEIDSFL